LDDFIDQINVEVKYHCICF